MIRLLVRHHLHLSRRCLAPAIGLVLASPALAVDIIHDEMPYSNFNYGAFDTRLFSSASDVLSEDYFVLDPLGPDTITDDRGSIDIDDTDGSDLATARTHLATTPSIGSTQRALAQTDFYSSRTYTDTVRTGEYEDDDGIYFATNRNSAKTESTWIDEWTFNTSGWVEVEVTFDADIYLNPHISGNFAFNEFAVNNSANDLGILGIEEVNFDEWDFDFDARFGIFDRETLVEGEDDGGLVPENVGSVRVVATTDFEILPGGGGVIESEDRLALESGEDISIQITETVRFFATAGHRYHVVNDVRNDSDDGVTVDAFHTVALEVVRTEPGMLLESRAVQDLGAFLNVQTIPEIPSLWLIPAGMAILWLGCRAGSRKRNAAVGQ